MSTRHPRHRWWCGPGTGERSLAAGRAYLIGRDPQADIAVTDVRVSWHHAELRPGQRPLGAGRPRQHQRQLRGRPPGGPDRDRRAAPGPAGRPRGRAAARLRPADYTGETRRIGRSRTTTSWSPTSASPATTPSCARRRADTASWTWAATTAPSSTSSGSPPRRWPRGTRLASATPRSGWPAANCARLAAPGAGADAARARPDGRNRDRGCRGAGPDPAEGGDGTALAASRSRSRTRCAGWCRGASGSRTSTS